MDIFFKQKNIILGGLIFVTAVFPYISFFHTPFDTQPWALLLGLIFALLFIKGNRKDLKSIAPKPLIILLGIFLYATIFLAINLFLGKSDLLDGARSLLGYLSIIILAFVSYKIWAKLPVRLYLASLEVWFIIGLAQLLLAVNIVAIILPRFASGGRRGITSLAPEPAFYATMCIFFLVLNEILFREKKYGTKIYFLVVFVSLFQIIFSYSGIGMLLVMVFAGAKGLQLFYLSESMFDKKIVIAVVLMCALSVGVFFFNRNLQSTRAGYVLRLSLTDPGSLFRQDFSISNRLGNLVLGVYGGVVETRGVGFGLGAKSEKPIPEWIARVHGQTRLWGGRIEGGFVSAVYELGLVGIGFVATIFFIVVKSIRKNYRMAPTLLLSAIAIFCPFVLFGSIANPLLGILLGVHLCYAYPEPNI